MALKLYNTLSRRKEVFRPIKKGRVGIYVCGPTCYSASHIGHARTYIIFDVIRRYLEYRGYKVKYVMNITDIHDDVIKKAKEKKTTVKKLTDKYTDLFLKDMAALNVKPADVYPRVSEHIPEIKKMNKVLLEKGYAYEQNDNIYYDVSKFKDYGKLSGIKLEEAKTGTRVETDKYERKDVADFALWKKDKQGERPGWHIECSTMSMKYLGEQFDIHGGARDLIFPHHENEIAQSEAASDKKPFVKYWLHAGLLYVNGQKMSKSLGNYIEIPDLLRKYEPRVIRFFVLSHHYRSPIDFTEKAMEQAKASLGKLEEFPQEGEPVAAEANGGWEWSPPTKSEGCLRSNGWRAFMKTMDDDFNTAKALAAIFQAKKWLPEIETVFGIAKKEIEIPEKIQKLVQEREQARKQGDWNKADQLRAKINGLSYTVRDTEQGPKVIHKK